MLKNFRLGKRGTAALNVFLALVLVVSLAPQASVFAAQDENASEFVGEVADSAAGDNATSTNAAGDDAAVDVAAADAATTPGEQGGASAEVSVAAEGANTAESSDSVATLAGSGSLAETTALLQTVLDKDANSNNTMYTTLYDADAKVISTNDPTKVQDDKYKPTEEGGQGATVAKGQEVRVYFRMASVTPNNADGEGTGVQEDTAYYMVLPSQLVPVATTDDGTKIVDPDEPVTFFNTGDIRATGGIYTKETGTYELTMKFENVVNRVDVSGEFQFTAKVSDGVESGSTVTADFNPAGTVSFNTPADPTPEPEADYTLKLEGNSAQSSATTASAFTWTATATTTKDSFEYKTLELSLPEGSGFQIGAGEQTYTLTIGEDTLSASAVTVNNSAGTATATFSNGATITFKLADSLDGLHPQGATAFITQKAYVQLPGNITAKNVVVSIPSVAYNDYTATGTSYTGSAVLGDGPAEDITAEGTTGVNYGNLSSPSYSSSVDNNNLDSSYEYLPEKVYTYIGSNTGSYYGNYYYMEFDPGTTNTANANYYISPASFYGGQSDLITSDNAGNSATFTSENAGTFLTGAGSTLKGWQYVTTAKVANLQSEGFVNSLGSGTDAKLSYQLKQVFASYGQGDSSYVKIYRSTDTYDGKYAYMVVDPNTFSTATYNTNGWKAYIEGFSKNSGGSKKAAAWKIHVFNAPSSQFVASMFQHLGTFASNDYAGDGTNGSGSNSSAAPGQISDTVNTGTYQASGATTTGSYTIQHQQATTMRSTYMTDDIVFWQMTFNAKNLAEWNNGELFMALEKGLSLSGGDNFVIDGSTLITSGMYIKNTSGGWDDMTGGSWSSYNRGTNRGDDLNNGTYTTTLDTSSGNCWSWHYAFKNGNSKNYMGSDGNITIGFFTYIDSNARPQDGSKGYKCSAEMVAAMADASVFAGADGKAFPSSGSGNPALASYRLSATAYATTPTINKGSSVVTGVDGNNAVKWNLNVNQNLYNSPREVSGPLLSGLQGVNRWTGFYSGNLLFTDDMKSSTVETLSGKSVNGVNAGEYTHVTRMFSDGFYASQQGVNQTNIIGPIPWKANVGDTGWQKFVDGAWVSAATDSTCWKADEAGIYRHDITPSYSSVSEYVYVLYAGNMYESVVNKLRSQFEQLYSQGETWLYSKQWSYDNPNTFNESLVVAVRGLQNATGMSDVTYETQLDEQALVAAANGAAGATGEVESLAASYNVKMTNQAATGTARKSGVQPTSSTKTQRVTAALSINKTVSTVDRSAGTTGNVIDYTLESQVGATDTKYVSLEDYLTGYTDSGSEYNHNGTAGEKTYTLENNADAVKALAANMDVDFNAITITATDGLGQDLGTVYENGAFTSDWTGSVINKDTASATKGKNSLLFFAKLQKADGSDIAAGTIFKVAYKARVVMDAEKDEQGQQTFAGFRSSDYYAGGGLKIANSAIAERPYDSVSGNSLEGTEAAAVVETAQNVFSDDQINDEGVAEASDEVATLASDGGTNGEVTDGKLRVWPTADITQDALTPYVILKSIIATTPGDGSTTTSWLYYDWTGMQGKNNPIPSLSITDKAEFTLGNFADLYKGDNAKEKATQLATIMAKHFSISNVKVYITDKDHMPEAKDGGTTLTDSQKIGEFDGTITGDKTITDSRGKELKLTYNGEIGSKVDPDTGEVTLYPASYAVTAADLEYQHYLATTYDLVFDQAGFIKEAQEAGLLDDLGHSETGATPEADLVNRAKDDAGNEASAPGKIEVESATFSKNVVDAEAAKAGTAEWKLEANTGTSSGTVTFTDELSFTGTYAKAAKDATSLKVTSVTVGDEDVTSAAKVEIDGVKLTVTLDGVAANKAVEVHYTSTLDKSAYVAAIVDADVSTKDATYEIENNAAMAVGNAKLSDSKKQEVKPDTTIDSQKEAGENVAGLSGIKFTAVGKANDAARTNFTMVDTVKADNAAQDALKVTALTVTVTQADGTSATYDAADLIAGSVEGYTLTTAEGESFALNTVGTYNWKLVAAQLAAGAQVSVDYTLAVDVATYKDTDGATIGGAIKVLNSLNVSAADGSTSESQAEGKVSVKPGIYKLGKDAGKSKDGNKLIQWSFDVNLDTVFDSEALAKLESATIKDKLDPRLKADLTTVKVVALNQTVDATTEGDALAADEYEVALAEDNTFTVTLKNPASYTNVRVYLTTEVAGSFSDLTNSVDLEIDGKTVDGDKYDTGEIIAVAQYGYITSATVPAWTAVAKKTVDNAAPGEGKTFTFQLTEVADAQGTPLEGATVSTATNDAEGAVTFGTVRYNTRPYEGMHYYKVCEDPNSVDANWYDYDASNYIVKVEVTKSESGDYVATETVLSKDGAAVSAGDEGTGTDEGAETTDTTAVAFNNTSKKAAGTQATFEAKKVLNGTTLAADQFTFDLKDADGNVLQSVKNAADGTVEFAPIEYDAEGTHEYTIVEEAGSAAGYTYDATEHTVKVVVANTDENKLAATVTYDDAEAAPVFTNTYTADATSVPVQATKKLEGAALKADQFSFVLTSADGSYSETKTNAADGSVTFTPLAFDAAGTYNYSIKEVIPEQKAEGYTYDTSEHKLVVTVTDNGEGKLVAEAKYDDSTTAPVFTNTYKKNEEGGGNGGNGGNGGGSGSNGGTSSTAKKATSAQTGDNTGMQVSVLAGLALAAFALALYARRGMRMAAETRGARVSGPRKSAARAAGQVHAHAQRKQATVQVAKGAAKRTQAATYGRHSVHKRR